MKLRIIQSIFTLTTIKFLIFFNFLIYTPTSIFSQNIIELEKLVASDGAEEDEAGTSVSISGNYAVVGAWKEDHDEVGNDSIHNAGAAYIYERNLLGDWVEMAKIVASDREEGDQFGKAVAVEGNIIVVGANLENIDLALENAGATYIFEKDNLGAWIETQKLITSDRAEDDQFGNNVSLSGDYLIIGAPFEDQDTMNMNTKPDAGAAYVFKKGINGLWVEQIKLVAQDREVADLFGIDVSIFDSTIVVGAYKEDIDMSNLDAGAAYIFSRDINDKWTETQKLISSDRAATDFFGFSVGITQCKVVVGAYFEDEDEINNNTLAESGSAYIFEKDDLGTWNEVKKVVAIDRDAGDYFGYDVSIAGNIVFVGAPLEDNDPMGSGFKNSSGSGYVFERDSQGNWMELEKVVASNRGFFHFFGTSVSNSSDHFLVGAPFADIDPLEDDDAGMSYVFQGECFGNMVLYYDSVPPRTFIADTSVVTFEEVNVLDANLTVFQASQYIILNDGFTAKIGSNFLAKIDDCVILPLQSDQVNNATNKDMLIDLSPNNQPFPKLNLKVSPNPNDGEMKIHFDIPDQENFQLHLFHSSGQLIQNIISGQEKGKYVFDFSKKNLMPGIYFLVLKTDSKKTFQKLIITNTTLRF